MTSLGVVGVPTSAGSHNAGQDKAPAAFRAAGLLDKLAAAGLDVEDFGDLPTEVHRPAPPIDGVRDLARVLAIVERTAERVAAVAAAGRLPLVLGGDCTITLGVVAGLAQAADVGLVYFDGDADLSLPETTESAVLDTMGMTHLLGAGVPALAGFGPRHPLLAPDQVVLVGFDPAELDSRQWSRLAERHLYAAPAPAVRPDPSAAALGALAALAGHAGSLLVHFDVDVLDTGAFPLANFPHFAGLTLGEATTCLKTFCAAPAFGGLVVTEVNPDHDPAGVLLPALVDTLVQALSRAA